MLVELRVRDLGVIEDVSIVLGPGMTALTGETGAGKTLIVEAIELLMGGRADGILVRPGATEALIEGRFVIDDTELVLARAVPRSGRSRAYVDGRMSPVSALADAGRSLVDLHGQHAHQSLLSTGVQRAALDRFAGVDLGPLSEARAAVASIEARLAELGGDERARSRQIDLLRFQVGELDAARLTDPDEEAHLEALEDRLAEATSHREAAAQAASVLGDDEGATDLVGRAIAAVSGRRPYEDIEARLRAAAAEIADIAAAVRDVGESIEEDPARLDEVRSRRQLLHDLRRKYGETLADVIAFDDEARRQLDDLVSAGERAIALEAERAAALSLVASVEAAVGASRRKAAPTLAAAIEERLHDLAMARARLEVDVGATDPGDDVTFLLVANAGDPPLPLAKVASGGELARAMLAARLVLTEAPPTLVFDEVDAGIGGQAAAAVGRALGALAADHQVLVVTHLPQVAAFADAHVAVTKTEVGGRTVASVEAVDDASRVVELSRMLSGQPDSTTARHHAEELLAVAARERQSSS
jgi:DNA repair protein RecN (Recombination protein N)